MPAPKGNKNNLGKKWTPEQRSRHSLLKKGKPNGRLGTKQSKEARAKIAKSLTGNQYAKGHIMTIESRKKMSDSGKGRKHWWGDKISESLIKLFENPENCPNWQGGLSFEPYSKEWTKKLKEIIRNRDSFTCQLCGEKQGEKTHAVHHIDYDKKNCEPNNLITLCHSCHMKTNFHRQEWINKFKLYARHL